MPPRLKALVTIAIWMLFITGSVTLLAVCIGFLLAAVGVTSAPREPFAFAVAGSLPLMLSVIAAWFRKKLD